MAGKNQVLLTFAGDSTDLEKSLNNVGAGAKKMGSDVGRSAGGLDRVGEAGGRTETSMLGLGAGISGVSTIMSGDAGPEDYAMAVADLGDSIEHFVIPAIKKFGTNIIATGANALTSAAQHVGAAATTVASWVMMGVQATINAAKMAAAWLISLGPIALVILAVGAVIGILAMLGIGFDDVANVAKGAWEFITNAAATAKNWLAKNWPLVLAILTGPFGLAVLAIARNKDSILEFFRGIPGAISGFFTGLADIIKAPFSAAFSAIKRLWNSTVGGFGFDGFNPPGPGSIPGFRIPRMHQGGIFPGAPGTEGLALLQAGERVTKAGSAGGTTVNVYVAGSIRSDRDLVQVVRDELTRGGLGGAL